MSRSLRIFADRNRIDHEWIISNSTWFAVGFAVGFVGSLRMTDHLRINRIRPPVRRVSSSAFDRLVETPACRSRILLRMALGAPRGHMPALCAPIWSNPPSWPTAPIRRSLPVRVWSKLEIALLTSLPGNLGHLR